MKKALFEWDSEIRRRGLVEKENFLTMEEFFLGGFDLIAPNDRTRMRQTRYRRFPTRVDRLRRVPGDCGGSSFDHARCARPSELWPILRAYCANDCDYEKERGDR